MVICHSRRIYLLKFTVVFSISRGTAKLRSFADIDNASCKFESALNLLKGLQLC